MKTSLITSITVLIFCHSHAQHADHTNLAPEHEGCTPVRECITESQLKKINTIESIRRKEIYASDAFKNLIESNTLRNATQMHTMFAWPLKPVTEYAHIPFEYTIEFYVDHQSGSGLLDYQCDQRTYNGHHGTDINIWPFFWHMMAEEYVHVVAAAPGIVMTVDDDNNNDQNCAGCNMTDNNYVSILHADSSISYYLHIKNNSALVSEEDIVKEGDPIAFVGSSGCSYNPHLHFEVKSANNTLIDPFAGDCNSLNGNDTWWQDQKPYWEPRINRMMTHSAEPALHGYDGSNDWCPSGEEINKKNQFNPGNVVWFGAAIYTPQPDDEIDFWVYEPNGDVLWTDTYTYPDNEPSVKRYYTFSEMLAGNAATGTYRFRALYNGVVYNHWFTVSCTDHYTLSGVLPFHHGYIASNYIHNTGQTSTTHGSTGYYQAENQIRLLPGFWAKPGVSLTARIRDCRYIE